MGLEVIMRESFALSYGLLCALLVLQGLVLHEALKRAARLSRLLSEAEEHLEREVSADSPWHIPAGTRLPEFAAPLLGTDRILTQTDLEGRETVLFFVSPADAASAARHATYHRIGPAFGSMWETVEGEVYLVCKENRLDCQRFANGGRVKAIWDADGLLFRTFFIDKTPRAVHLDEEAKVTRYGEPDELRQAPGNAFNAVHDQASGAPSGGGGLADGAAQFYHKDEESALETRNGVGRG
jgi:hypothetical protein